MSELIRSYLPPMLLAIGVTASFLWRFRSLASRVGLVDVGGGRKLHGDTVPVVGGVAIFVGFSAGLLLAEPNLRPIGLRSLLLAVGAMAFVGLMDDFHEFSPRTKLVCQSLTALFVTGYAGVVVSDLGRILPDGATLQLGWAAVPFSVVCIVGVMNAVNMLDGVDGLAGGLAVVAAGTMALLAVSGGRNADAGVLLVMLAAVAAFLWFNFPHTFRPSPRVFMGDCGALLIGCVFAWFSISLTLSESRVAAPVDMVWILGVFLLDLFGAFFGRFMRRANPLAPDHHHVHHVMMKLGLSTTQAGYALISLGTSFALFGAFGHLLIPAESTRLLLALFIFFAYLMLVRQTFPKVESHAK